MYWKMLTVAAYPVLKDKEAPRPCMPSRSLSSLPTEMLTVLLQVSAGKGYVNDRPTDSIEAILTE
jgi:hypothetical protein